MTSPPSPTPPSAPTPWNTTTTFLEAFLGNDDAPMHTWAPTLQDPPHHQDEEQQEPGGEVDQQQQQQPPQPAELPPRLPLGSFTTSSKTTEPPSGIQKEEAAVAKAARQRKRVIEEANEQPPPELPPRLPLGSVTTYSSTVPSSRGAGEGGDVEDQMPPPPPELPPRLPLGSFNTSNRGGGGASEDVEEAVAVVEIHGEEEESEESLHFPRRMSSIHRSQRGSARHSQRRSARHSQRRSARHSHGRQQNHTSRRQSSGEQLRRMSRRSIRPALLVQQPSVKESMLSAIHQSEGIRRLESFHSIHRSRRGGDFGNGCRSPTRSPASSPPRSPTRRSPNNSRRMLRVPPARNISSQKLPSTKSISTVVTFPSIRNEDEDENNRSSHVTFDTMDRQFLASHRYSDYSEAMVQDYLLSVQDDEEQPLSEEELKHTDRLIHRLQILKQFFAFFFGLMNGVTFQLSERYATIMTGNVLALAQNLVKGDWADALFTIILILSYQLGSSFFFVVWYDDNTASYLGLPLIRRSCSKLHEIMYNLCCDPYRHQKYKDYHQKENDAESGFVTAASKQNLATPQKERGQRGNGPIDTDEIYDTMQKEMKYYDADQLNFDDSNCTLDISFENADILVKGSQMKKGATIASSPTKVAMPSSPSDENSSGSGEEELDPEEREEMEKEFDEEWVDVIFVIAFIFFMGLLSDYLKVRTGCSMDDATCTVEGFYYLCPLSAITGVIGGGYLSVHPTGVITNMITGHLGKLAQNGVKIALPSMPTSEKEAEAFRLSFGICLSFFIGAVGGFAVPSNARSFEFFTAHSSIWGFMMSLLIFVFHSTFNELAMVS